MGDVFALDALFTCALVRPRLVWRKQSLARSPRGRHWVLKGDASVALDIERPTSARCCTLIIPSY